MIENIVWIKEVLERETENKLHGSVMFTFQDGKVVRCCTERSEKPPVDLNAKK